jgi:hypothetical protein
LIIYFILGVRDVRGDWEKGNKVRGEKGERRQGEGRLGEGNKSIIWYTTLYYPFDLG